MFFLFSKILAFTIAPLTWIIVLLFFAVFSKNETRKKKCLYWTLGLTLFFSNSFIFDEAARLWEIPATPYEKVDNYEYAILLGGMSVDDEELDRVQFFRGVDRLIQTIDLYKRGKVKKIIFTGGSGRVLKPEMKEAALVKPYILKMGVAEEDLIIENESKNTRENALFTKKIVDSLQLKNNFLLVTSAFHMRRSLGCFQKTGYVVTPYSTDRYAGPRKYEFDHLLVPNISTINDWNNLVHEIVGYFIYKIMGYA
jgi:uncharacterized SAM-binding protein YcdF (DUF218 family)